MSELISRTFPDPSGGQPSPLLDGDQQRELYEGEPPLIVTNVALTSIVDLNGRFYVHRLPDDHSRTPGKIELLSEEFDPETSNPFEAAASAFTGRNLDMIHLDSDFLGQHHRREYYLDDDENRHTVRTFLTTTVSDEMQGVLEENGLESYTIKEFSALYDAEFRRPEIRASVIYHSRVVKGLNRPGFMWRAPTYGDDLAEEYLDSLGLNWIREQV